MYLKKLELKNFQCVRDFNADFEGNVYLISGENELGKSTILKAVGALLTGDRDDVLTAGEKKGFAKAVIGGDGETYEVCLSYTEANPRGTLTIKHPESGMQSNNVSMLQKIFSYQNFDAVEFSHWSETAEGRRKQIEVIKQLLPPAVLNDIDAMDARASELRSERTGVNRDIKTAAAICDTAAKDIAPGDAEKYAKEIDVTELMQEQAQRAQLDAKAVTVENTLKQRIEQLARIPQEREAEDGRYNVTMEQLKQRSEQAKRDYEALLARISSDVQAENNRHIEAMKQIDANESDYQTRKQNCENWLAKYHQSTGNETVQERVQKAMEHNAKCRQIADYNQKTAALQGLRDKVAGMESELKGIAERRAALINGANLPVKGLSFTDDGLTLNGIPFTPGKVSDSQIMEVAAQLIVATNPKVKIFRIGRGESLGAARLAAIVEMAKKNGFQGFIENVVRGQQEMSIDEYTEAE